MSTAALTRASRTVSVLGDCSEPYIACASRELAALQALLTVSRPYQDLKTITLSIRNDGQTCEQCCGVES